MPIAANPKRKPAPDAESRATAFIAGAGAGAGTGSAAPDRRAPVMIRFDPALLARVDEAARRRGVSRSAWVQFTLSRALDAGEG